MRRYFTHLTSKINAGINGNLQITQADDIVLPFEIILLRS